jgi:hypothetical protein
MPNWGEKTGNKSSFADPNDYEDEIPFRDQNEYHPIVIKSTDKSLPKSTTTLSLPLSCNHGWRACSGKFGAYWWCYICNSTKSIFIYNKQNILKENTSTEWNNLRNASAEERTIQIQLAAEQSPRKKK